MAGEYVPDAKTAAMIEALRQKSLDRSGPYANKFDEHLYYPVGRGNATRGLYEAVTGGAAPSPGAINDAQLAIMGGLIRAKGRASNLEIEQEQKKWMGDIPHYQMYERKNRRK